MKENWNWKIDGNSIIEEIDPSATGLAPILGGSTGLIRKAMRGILSDSEFIHKFGLVDRINEGIATGNHPPEVAYDRGAVIIDTIQTDWLDDASLGLHTALQSAASFIPYTLFHHIKDKFNLISELEVYNKLGILLQESELKLTVSNIEGSKGVYGFNIPGGSLPLGGHLEPSNIGNGEITLLATLGTYLAEDDKDKLFLETKAVKLHNLDIIYIKIDDLDKSKLTWNAATNGYIGVCEGVDVKMIDSITNTLNITLFLSE